MQANSNIIRDLFIGKYNSLLIYICVCKGMQRAKREKNLNISNEFVNKKYISFLYVHF